MSWLSSRRLIHDVSLTAASPSIVSGQRLLECGSTPNAPLRMSQTLGIYINDSMEVPELSTFVTDTGQDAQFCGLTNTDRNDPWTRDRTLERSGQATCWREGSYHAHSVHPAAKDLGHCSSCLESLAGEVSIFCFITESSQVARGGRSQLYYMASWNGREQRRKHGACTYVHATVAFIQGQLSSDVSTPHLDRPLGSED